MFIQALEKENNITTTLNNAKAYKSTLNSCVDLFGNIAACRNNIDNATKLFDKAFGEDEETAIRILFWCRDIRGGQGERKIFREIIKNIPTKIINKIINFIPEYGRWDDLFALKETESWPNVLNFVKIQLLDDIKNMNDGKMVSLLGKWMPSNNTSSIKSRKLAGEITKYLGWNSGQYRVALVALRKYIKIVEQKMCANKWTDIEYDKVPSVASLMYRKAFSKHDQVRYKNYINDVKSGKAKINTATLYPYDIVYKYLYENEQNNDTLEVLWNNLPNYMTKPMNGLVVADVSGSMFGKPMAVSISLAMYIAERNTGIWKNKFLTFSAQPELQTVCGNTLYNKIKNLEKSAWGLNTDLMAIFNLILDTGINNDIPQEEMPEKIFIISDMQFDQATTNNNKTNFEKISQKYEKAGYKLPQIVFWNVNSHENVPITIHDTGTALVSGLSPSILTTILENIVDPVSIMKKTVYNHRYDPIGVALSN